MIEITNYRLFGKIGLIVAFSLWLEAGNIYAQDTLTLEKCIQLALINNQSIKIAEQRLIEAEGKKQEAFAGFLPKLNAGLTYTKLNEAKTMDIPAGIFSPMPISMELTNDRIYNAKLSLTQPLFTWGKIYQANEQAKLNYLLAQEEYQKIKNDLICNVSNAFYSVLLSQQFVNISQEAYQVMSEHLKVSRSLYEEGRISNYDVARVKVQVTNTKTDLIKIKNSQKLALEFLYNLLNTNFQEDVNIETELEYKPDEKDLNQCLTEALIKRPEIKQMQIRQQILESVVKITKAEDKPTLFFIGNYDWENDGWSTNINDWDKRWTAMVSLNIPVFDGFSTNAKIKQSQSQLEQFSFVQQQLTEAIKLEVKKAFFDLQGAKDRIEAQTENVDLARDNLKIAHQRFQQGLMSDIEVRDAQLALAQAETNYFQSLYDYSVAQAALKRAVAN